MDTERGEVAKAGAQRASPTPQDDPSREIMTTRENAEIREIKIYDTMSRAKRVLEPIEPGKICMYVCGVTVYDLSHIGHARTFVTFDVVQRFLRHVGYDVKFVRNHTDVDDKIIARAAEKNIPALELSANFIDAFNEDMAALGLMPPDVEPKVSTHIPEIIEMVETLIEKAEETFVAEEAEAAAARLLEGTFTLDDFLEQLRALRKMGSISSIMGMVPGMAGQVRDLDEAVDERRIDRIEGIINSMTPAERLAPDVIDGSRRARIAAGSGTQVGEINQLVKQFREMRKMMKQMGGRGPGGRKAGRARKKKGRGGRVTAAGPAPIDKKKGLSLPGLGDLPGDQGPSSGGLDLTGLWPSD